MIMANCTGTDNQILTKNTQKHKITNPITNKLAVVKQFARNLEEMYSNMSHGLLYKLLAIHGAVRPHRMQQ